jgi:D-glycero-alpha-D-manno-heptose-7-phosphate kinase
VQVAVYPRVARPDQIVLNAENYGERFAIVLGQIGPERHRLLEAAIEELAPPEEYALEIAIYSEVPACASTGTSAAVTVALIGALDALTPGRLTPYEIAYRAHRVEVERLGLQSGIQDQLCAAYGALNFIEMNEKEFSLFLSQVRMSWSPSIPSPLAQPQYERSIDPETNASAARP